MSKIEGSTAAVLMILLTIVNYLSKYRYVKLKFTSFTFLPPLLELVREKGLWLLSHQGMGRFCGEFACREKGGVFRFLSHRINLLVIVGWATLLILSMIIFILFYVFDDYDPTETFQPWGNNSTSQFKECYKFCCINA